MQCGKILIKTIIIICLIMIFDKNKIYYYFKMIQKNYFFLYDKAKIT